MLRAPSWIAVVTFAIGCGAARPANIPLEGAAEGRPASPGAAAHVARAVVADEATGASAPSPAAAASGHEAKRGGDPADARAGAEATSAPPPPVPRAGKVWPYHPWNRAAAVTFNHFPIQPGVPLYAYDERGESPHIVDREPISLELAQKADQLVKSTKGDVVVSKCPFPRHALILYDGEIAVASINVCFECGDILLWPRWESEPVSAHRSSLDFGQEERRAAEQRPLYKVAFPRWEALFRDDVGFPIDARYR